MFPHRHSQLCLPDAPTSLDSSVGLDVKGEAEPGSSVRRPSCAYFQTPWSQSCLSHKPQLSILYPFILVLFLAQLSNKGIFSASTSRHPIPALDCTVNEGLFSFTLVSFYIPQWLMLMKISHSKFNSQKFFVVVVVDRENPFQGTLTTNAGLTFPCSPNPSSIFSSVTGCILEKGIKALPCFLATKQAEQQIHRAESQSVTEPRAEGTTGRWALHGGVQVSPSGGCRDLVISSPELCDRTLSSDYRHVLAVVWRWILWGTFTAQVFHLSHWFQRWNLCPLHREESVCKLYIHNIWSLQL